MRKTYRTGEPCKHPGCLNHVSHPCEICGRIAGMGEYTPPYYDPVFELQFKDGKPVTHPDAPAFKE